jgi:hypothetical protein
MSLAAKLIIKFAPDQRSGIYAPKTRRKFLKFRRWDTLPLKQIAKKKIQLSKISPMSRII